MQLTYIPILLFISCLGCLGAVAAQVTEKGDIKVTGDDSDKNILSEEVTSDVPTSHQKELVPEIIGESVLQHKFGDPVKYTIRAENSPLAFSIKDLPFWLTHEGAVITGSAIKSGQFKLIIYALNKYGVSKPFSLELNVSAK